MSTYKYQWEKLVNTKAKKNFNDLKFITGPRVLKRYRNKKAKTVKFRIYVNQKYARIKLIGPFNDWGKKDSKDFILKPDSNNQFYSITLDDGLIKHKSPYLFLVNGEYRRDPASVYFDAEGNSIFWDFDDPSTYKFEYKQPSLNKRSIKILQTDLPGLIAHYRSRYGKLGWEEDTKNYYKFVRTSGVIAEIKKLGFNTIQFLPIAQSIDGSKWNLRYLVPFLYSINTYWGTPDDFKKMIDAFHKEGIAVILDLVISHAPYKDFKLFNIPSKDLGIHQWKKLGNKDLFLSEITPWDTKRYDIDDKNVREFVIHSALHYLKNYGIDGFRIDNVDGIIREGGDGEGKERKNGRTFLREFCQSIYDYSPRTIIHFEAHYFSGNNAKWLTMPLDSHNKALGASAYTSSRLTYYLHTEYMPKSSEAVSVWKFKHINDEKEWGDSNSTIADFHNHDAAAGLMSMRATGSYAYDAITLKNNELHHHAVGKIKVMDALISFLTEGRVLNLLQTFLLQTGTFDHDSSIHWFLDQYESTRGMLNYKQRINTLLDEPEFWPNNFRQRQIINLDEKSKTLTILRSTKESKGAHGYIVCINTSSAMAYDFVLPVTKNLEHELVLNSDEFQYSGSGRTFYQTKYKPEETSLFELFKYGIKLPQIAPYGVVVFKF